MTKMQRAVQAEGESRKNPRNLNNEGARSTFIYRDDDELDKPFNMDQMKRLIGYMKPYRSFIILSLSTTLLGAAIRLVIPYLIGLAIDKAIRPADLGYLGKVLITLLAMYFALWGVNAARIWYMNNLGQKVLLGIRRSLFSHIQSLSYDFFDKRPAGSILVRITNDVDSLQELFSNGIVNMLVDLVSLVGITAIIVSISPKLALASMVVLPVMILASTKLRKRIRYGWEIVRTTRTRINVHLNEALQGMKVTQAYTRENTNNEFFDAINRDHRNSWSTSSRVADAFNPIIEITRAAGTCLVYWYGAILVKNGDLTLGLLVSFNNYLGNFWDPISRLGQVYNQMLQAMASSDRIFELLDTKPAVSDVAEGALKVDIAGRVDFDNVTFSYTPDRPALVGIDLHIEPSEMVALVGHTGSGKTTIVNLIGRFYDTTGGTVLIDGVDVRDISIESLRSQMGIVLQDTFLFSGTLMDNIRFGRLDATDEEVVEASKAARAHDFISRLPAGYETVVYERGSGVSLGQRQLISFARALLANPRILILDEATASIDTETEALIQEALERVLSGRTSFVVAHRLSTIKKADRIVVLEHGSIMEMGKHEELMALRGRYYDLIQAQFRFASVEPKIDNESEGCRYA